ncbi:hypothetical protein RchiOBHm_Chr7g0220951 [Rosa chinensis]|uniref:Uncharacterized protein n=1 Tax=Rosa chinensis TaxID=74649 RepID=A0A2P6PCY3_ROSCH|nr:hypothetical protein RchiOBHm_Chr7g0220951 [Rosa chinensis]
MNGGKLETLVLDLESKAPKLHDTRWMMAARRLQGFFFSSSLCLKTQRLETRGWRESLTLWREFSE